MVRRFLGVAALLAMLSATACGSSGSAPTPIPLPNSGNVAGTSSGAVGQQVASSPISHVIVVTMENRTPDNLFGLTAIPGFPVGPYPGADVIPAGIALLHESAATGTVGLESADDPGHSWQELINEWDGGKMDGFAADPINPIAGATFTNPTFTFASVPPNETVIYDLLAYQYGFADRMFSSDMVPSFPGHQYMVAGQSGAADDPNHPLWGCDEPPTDTVASLGPGETESTALFPCYDYQTLGDQMDAKNISWKYYTGNPGTIDGNIDAYGAIKHMRFGPDFGTKIVAPADSIETDLVNCTLPSVSYINAPAFASDHSATLSAGGPGFVGDLYLQLQQTHTNTKPNCNYAANTAMIVTWDDAGGWFDHVLPPVDKFGTSYGFRVPLLVLSPFATSGFTAAKPTGYMPFVSHHFHDYGSIIRYIQENFGLTPGGLGKRDAFGPVSGTANTGGAPDDLSDMFNYKQTPVPPLAGILLEDVKRAVLAAKASRHTPAGTPVDDDK